MTKGKFDSIKAVDSLGKCYLLCINGHTRFVCLKRIQLTKGVKSLFFYSSDGCLFEVSEHKNNGTISYKDVQLIEN